MLSDPRPQAFAIGDRIVVGDAMLRALTAAQQRVLPAHERAHISARHAVVLACAQVAAAVNPLLIPSRTAASYLCERDADETAARARLLPAAAVLAVGSLGLVAALATVVATITLTGQLAATLTR